MEHALLLIGIGGACSTMANRVHAELGGRLAHINAVDDIALHQVPAINVSTIALRSRRASARDADDARACAEDAREDLTQLLFGFPQVFLFAGLGRAIGSGAAPVVARLAGELWN